MFESIKNIFSSKKQVDFQNINETNSSGNFYPLFNSPYQLKQLGRGDYLNLYKSWSYAAITTVADSMSDLDYQLLAAPKSQREINHKYLKFITPDFLETTASFLKINGECFFWKVMIGNTIDELIPLRPDLIQIEQNMGGEVTGYRYNLGSANYVFQRDQLIIFKNFSPFDSLGYEARGIGDMQAIAVQAETDNAVINWNWNFFRNNASAGDIIEVPDVVDDETKKRFSSSWNNKFRGVNNAHKLAILDGGMKFVQNSRSQKEMDFVEQRRFTRDEILGIFKVPKAIIGLGEGVNVGNVKAFEIIFAKRTIKPLAKQIQEVLNQELFKGVGYFQFINIVPTDTEELRVSLDSGGITINEYRKAIGQPALNEGNILKLNPFQVSEPVTPIDTQKKDFNKKDFDLYKKIDISGLIKKKVRGTEEYEEMRWQKKIMRNDEWERKYNIQLQKIFKIQKEDILKQIKDTKDVSKPKWNDLKYLTLYHTLIGPIQKDLVEEEGNTAFEEINIDAVFQIGNPSTSKWLKDNIDKFGKEIDNTTKENILNEIDKGNKEGLGATQIARNVSRQFEILQTSRAESIVRTETIRASSFATQTAWKDSNVVESKEWWTAKDERVCTNCGPMHGKVIGLSDDFFKKGDTAPGGLKLNYSNTPASPLHPRCRCTLIPIIKVAEDYIDIEEKPVNSSKYSDQDIKNAGNLLDISETLDGKPQYIQDRITENAKKYNLNTDEVSSIISYTSDNYSEINKALRSEDKEEKYKSYTNITDYSLEKLDKFTGPTLRGMNLKSKERVNEFLKTISEKGYSDKAYTSTTRSGEMIANSSFIGEPDEGVLMVIKGKNGYDISPISLFEEEKEVLYARNSYFKVNKISKLKDLSKVEVQDLKLPEWYSDFSGELNIVYMNEEDIKGINPYLYEDKRFEKAFENWNKEYTKLHKV